MNTLTKEWLQNTITGIESIIDDKSFVCSEIAFEIGVVNNILTAFKIALASLAAVSDERAAYELFMEKRFGESVDRRRAKNGDREYMAWDMALGWIIWTHWNWLIPPVRQILNGLRLRQFRPDDIRRGAGICCRHRVNVIQHSVKPGCFCLRQLQPGL